MSIATLVARLVLASVFAVAALTKLADRPGARAAAAGFGLPASLVGPSAVLLPLAELSAAALLLPTTTAIAGSLVALVLLGAFAAAIAVNLVRGRRPDCHCFGRLHSEPIGVRTLARNGVLAGAALLTVLAGPGASGVAWAARLDALEVALLAAALLFAVLAALAGRLAFSLLRQRGGLLWKVDRLEAVLEKAGLTADGGPEPTGNPGTRAPRFELEDVRGGTVSLEQVLDPGLPLLLLFTSPACGPCRALLPRVAAWQREHADTLTIALLSAGDREEVRRDADEHGLANVLLDSELTAHHAYEAIGTPSAVLVSRDGHIAGWVAAGEDAVAELVAEATETSELFAVGPPAPALDLESLAGETATLGTGGRETLFLFWNPACGFCRSMHDELLLWEEAPPEGAPALVVVSSGSAELARKDGFRSLVVLDPEFAASSAFGATGTPMAVLVDRDGRIASPLAAGAEAIFALAGARITDEDAPLRAVESR
jgi:thiol-disulfide isomerase/thioredoxin/uncharacterized membrane protein YphA (DoxX/SURF4 family)